MASSAATVVGVEPAAVMEQPDDFSIDTVKLYLQEEGLTALNRIRSTILGTAAVTAVGSTLWATATNRNVSRMVPALTANAALAVTAFAVSQEGVRAVRRGQEDGWTSFWAGGLAGAALTRLAYGRGFHLLGAVLWAPLCGTLHWASTKTQAGPALQAWLVQHDLLDMPQYQQQQQVQALQQQQQQLEQQQQAEAEAAAATPKVPVRFEDMPWREKILAVEAVKKRELQDLHARLREEEAAALAADWRERQQTAAAAAAAQG